MSHVDMLMLFWLAVENTAENLIAEIWLNLNNHESKYLFLVQSASSPDSE